MTNARARPAKYLGAVARAGVGVLTAALSSAALVGRYGKLFGLLAGWNLGGLVLLLLSWYVLWTSDAAETQRRASVEDPGRTAVWVLVILTSAVSLFGAVFAAQRARHEAHALPITLLALCTVALSWALTHTAFTLRYAHLYYRDDDEGVGGVTFPGDEAPDYLDFAYLAFTLGMTFQTSDTALCSRRIRRLALLHAVLAFGYNTALLTFALNFAFSSAV